MIVSNIKIAGVPEHFNAPFHLAKQSSKFERHGVRVEWKDFPGGTGDMCKALSAGEVDVAIMLTEGTLAAALSDSNVKIVGVYVSSSAIWGVHAGKDSCKAEDIKDMQDEAVFGISRYGSGSHLMAYVLAENLGWDTESLKFEVLGGLQGATEELPKKGNLVFMWEKFTTLPKVKSGIFKRIGELPTPWPFFVIAANTQFIAKPQSQIALRKVMETVNLEAQEFSRGSSESLQYIKENYGIDPEAGSEWLKSVSWKCELSVDTGMLKSVASVLHRLKRIKTDDGKEPTMEQLQKVIVQFHSRDKAVH